jgi:acetyl-CoA C-acetyltransferase
VIVGVAQRSQRGEEEASVREPVELMVEVARAAAVDAGDGDLLLKLDSVSVVRGIWPYRDPGRLVADRLGLSKVRTAINAIGGNAAQELLLQSAADIQAGRRDVVLVCAAETLRTQRRHRREGRRTSFTTEPAEAAPDDVYADPCPLLDEAEAAAGIKPAVVFYAMVESALRHRRGESAEAHLRRIAELWASLSRVAAANPHAWTREARSADEIRAVGPGNRMIAHPYPKWMTSNVDVDQAVAVLLCSLGTARAAGVPEERIVYPWSGTHAHDHWSPSERERLDASPAMRIAGHRALELAGLTPGDVDLVDLYACFPSSVQVAQRELGLDESVVPSVGGGLTFAGGPLNSAVLHASARMVERLREAPESRGFVSGNGGYFTKHSFGVYAAAPPPRPFAFESPQAEIDALPRRRAATNPRGSAEIEAYTVTFEPDGSPGAGIVAAITAEGARAFAQSDDPRVSHALLEADAVGRTVRIDGARLVAVD